MPTDTPPPARSLQTIRCGFMPLVDCAPLVVAFEKGFAAAEGIDLALHREASWATLRDRLVVKHFDVAHMLAPLPVASNLGLMALNAPMIVPLALGLGGNAITISTALAAALDLPALATALDAARAIGRVAREASVKPAFAVTHPFSTHNYELRTFLAAGGLDPDRDVRLVVVPPPYMADALREGQIDGFCVGAPWSSLAVEAGTGVIIATKPEMLGASPEKVLGLRADMAEAHPDRLARLLRALTHAMAWCGDAAHHDELARLLAEPRYVNAPEPIIRRCLTGALVRRPGGTADPLNDYLVFDRQGLDFPLVAHGLWIYAQMVRWGHAPLSADAIAKVRATFRPDVLAAALGEPWPGDDLAPLPDLGRLDGQVFDPTDIAGYLAGFAAQAAAPLGAVRSPETPSEA